MDANNIRQHGLPLLKIQRPVTTKGSRPVLLIYSTDGKITPMVIPDESPYKDALGDRIKAYFSYTMENNKIQLGKEVYYNG